MTPTPAQNRRGIFAMMAAMAVFTGNDTLMKLVLERVPVGEAMVIRGLLALAVTAAAVAYAGHAGKLRLLGDKGVMLRAVFEAFGAITFFVCLQRLALADLVAITQTTPILIAVYCAVTGISRMGWRRWAAALVGFAGVLVIVKPGGNPVDPVMLVALLSAVLVAGRDIVTRSIAAAVPSVVVLASTSATVMLSGAALGLTETWHVPDARSLALIVCASLFVTLGQWFGIMAFRDVDVAVVSPFRYSVMIWATLSGFLVFGTFPGPSTLFGAALIAGSGLYSLHRERIRAREFAER